jgi:predicted nucleic-acid-binding Zn-ribbon protein
MLVAGTYAVCSYTEVYRNDIARTPMNVLLQAALAVFAYFQ